MKGIDDLSREKVEEIYSQIENDFYRELKKEHTEEIREQEEQSGEIEDRLEREYKGSVQRDKLLDVIAAPFLPARPDDPTDDGGLITRETGWYLRAIEPLRNLDVTTADAVIANTETGEAGIITCMPRSETTKSAVERSVKATHGIRENIRAISDQINMTVERDRLYPIIVVPEKHDRRIADKIVDLESSESIRETIYLCRANLTNSETLQLVTDISTRRYDECIPDGKMGEMMEGEVDVTNETYPTPDFYPSSHNRTKTSEYAKHIVMKRLEDDCAKTHFSDKDLNDYLKKQRNVPHFDLGNSEEQMADQLIDWWKTIDLVESLTSSRTKITSGDKCFRFDVDSRHPGKIMNAVENKCKDLILEDAIDLKAKRRVLEDFSDRQSDLDEFFS